VPLGQCARGLKRCLHDYRENGQRYIPIKFSVRGRTPTRSTKLKSAASLGPLAALLLRVAGEYESLRRNRRLAVVIPSASSSSGAAVHAVQFVRTR